MSGFLKREWGTITFIVVMAMAIFFYGLTMMHYSKSAEKNHRKDYVCEYLDGKVQGDICVKDGQIIETKFGKGDGK